jgi:hypothetical protein
MQLKLMMMHEALVLVSAEPRTPNSLTIILSGVQPLNSSANVLSCLYIMTVCARATDLRL